MAQVVSKVLFDLDGTLLDTAPGLAWALNQVRATKGLRGLDIDRIRPYVSHGSIALTRIACDAAEGSDEFELFRHALLQTYGDDVAHETRLFEGMAELLQHLEARSIPWGIVTNKPGWLTLPLLQALDLGTRAAVVISGDTVEQPKPHPAPLLLAAERLCASPQECVYVGDAERDIRAGKAAGMYTLTALYGYIGADDSPAEWGADAMVQTPLEIGTWLAC